MRRLFCAAGLLALGALVPGVGRAQTSESGSTTLSRPGGRSGHHRRAEPPPPLVGAKPVTGDPRPGPAEASAPAPEEPADPPAARSAHAAAAGSAFAGFETLDDGSTRVFVELQHLVVFEIKPAHGALTVVLKGVRVDRRNNTNPLVTVHFNTPVTTARLVPHGRDLWLVTTLRTDVQPTVTMVASDGGAVLRVDFAKGDYLTAAPVAKGSAVPQGPPSRDDDTTSPNDAARPPAP
jgi:hypothetical protein